MGNKLLSVYVPILWLFFGQIYFNLAPATTTDSITIMNVGQGDSSLFQCGSTQLLIDTGADDSVLYGLARNIQPFDRKIEYIMITHFHDDHYGGLTDVLARYKVGQILVGDKKVWGDYFTKVGFEGSVIDLDENVWRFDCNDNYSVNLITIDALASELETVIQSPQKNENNNSVVAMVEKDGETVGVLTGDMEAPMERYLAEFLENEYFGGLNGVGFQADDFGLELSFQKTNSENSWQNKMSKVLGAMNSQESRSTDQNNAHKGEYQKVNFRTYIYKAGHHCSNTSSSEKLLEVIKPKYSICSLAKDNKFKHPGKDTISRFIEFGVEYFFTYDVGDLTIVFV